MNGKASNITIIDWVSLHNINKPLYFVLAMQSKITMVNCSFENLSNLDAMFYFGGDEIYEHSNMYSVFVKNISFNNCSIAWCAFTLIFYSFNFTFDSIKVSECVIQGYFLQQFGSSGMVLFKNNMIFTDNLLSCKFFQL